MPRVQIKDISIINDFFCVVDEPAFSKGKLEQLQEKYGINTGDFIVYEDFFNVSEEDGKDWNFYYKIYTNSGGVLDDLSIPECFEYLDTLKNHKSDK